MRRAGILERLTAILADAGLETRVFEGVPPEPMFDIVDTATAFTRSAAADIIIGLGGGSVMDVAKVVAFLAPTELSIRSLYGEVPIEPKGLPYVAIPTTAGTGSEMTPNSVFIDPETRVKSSVRSELLLADLVVCDPELTVSAPPDVTAYAGMDALTQAVEAYVSRGATVFTDALARDAAVRIGSSIRAAYADGTNLEARTDMLLGSTMAGMALANARLGAVHGMAHPIGSRYGIGHGQVCAMLLPHVIRFNSEPVYDDAAVSVAKYAAIAKEFDVVPRSTPDDPAARALADHIDGLNSKMGIPKHFGELGLRPDDFPELIEQSMPSGSMAHNPRHASYDDLRAILDAAV
jgi:alcohol dehydrogenase class IV